MSFFYDIFESSGIGNVSSKTIIVIAVGVGASVVGNVKLKHIEDNCIILASKKEKIAVFGEKLIVKSISKGEIVISGNVARAEVEGGGKL